MRGQGQAPPFFMPRPGRSPHPAFLALSDGKAVEVGTALASRPPHGSGRAELPHPALALGDDAYSFPRIRLTDSGRREPFRF